MLLETLDIKKDDVVIFSQNLFNKEKNFKVIYKDDPKKNQQDISYGEVCRFINEYTPKNLIVYRLLTNIKDFQINLSKYGYMLNIDGKKELIYFDPVYAVKELEDYPEAINFYDLRFRIQQVGLTTLNRLDDLPNYAEIYSIDLVATEAKFQNDKVFADAIFLFSKPDETEEAKKTEHNFIKKVKPLAEETLSKSVKKKENDLEDAGEKLQSSSKESKDHAAEKIVERKDPASIKTDFSDELNYNIKPDKEHIEGIKIIHHDISEDKDFDYNQIMKMNFRNTKADKSGGLNEDKKEQDSSKLNVTNKAVSEKIHSDEKESSFGKFLKDSKAHQKEAGSKDLAEEKSSPLIDIFKSSASLDKFVKEREDKKIVLKLNKK